jgi:Na+/melibiose symporter-like transporter
MTVTRDIDETEMAEDEGGFDPRAAADLLKQTRRRAERRFELRSPWLALVGAAVVVVAFGALWLSVRGQHPYKGPTAPALVFMYAVLIAWIGLVAKMTRRATAGVSGRSVRQLRAFGAAVVTALVAVSIFQGVLKQDGVSATIVYGIYPPTAQLIVLGALGAVNAASREQWPGFGVGIALMLIAAAAAFAGPVGVWLWDGIGCAIAVLGYAAAQAWLDNR